MGNEPMYDEWLASRRAAKPSPKLIEGVMAKVERQDLQRESYVRITHRINDSRFARRATCVAAVLVGSLPFLFVAYAAHLLVF